MSFTDEKLSPCIVCKKVWKRGEVDKYVYHNSVGVVCLHHHGVKEWYKQLLIQASKSLISILPQDY